MTSRAVGGAKSPCRKCRPLFLAYAPNASHASNTSTTSPISQSRLVTPAAIAGVVPSVFIRRFAAELVALAPDVILASGTATVGALRQATRTVPIVLANVTDPVGAGFVDSLARPGGNVTGFLSFEYGMGGKWLELLKQIAPGVTRVAVIRDPAISAGTGQFEWVRERTGVAAADVSQPMDGSRGA